MTESTQPFGDSALTLRELIPLLERKTDRSWRDTIESGIKDWWKVLEARAMNSAKACGESAAPFMCGRLRWIAIRAASTAMSRSKAAGPV